jgi:hypothetical protein
MKALRKILLIVLVMGCAGLLTVHGIRSLRPAVPKDMPEDSQFLGSGFDLSHNEPQGNWIECHPSEAEDSDFCRITDVKGTVMFQGEYLPLTDTKPLDPSNPHQVQVAKVKPDNLWVRGPAEGQPVPVIPLTDGRVLVPADDREALAARWSAEPEELERVSEPQR